MLAADRITVSPPGATAPVIEDFSIAVGRGERVAVTGPIGRGKTSLALAVSGLIPVAAGSVSMDGRPLELRSPERRRIAVVLQEPTAQLTQPTVREEVEFVARNLGLEDAGRRADEWIQRLGLSAEAAALPLQLSAGRQQLVLLASALAADPAFLVVDEGTAHLDSSTRSRVLGEVESLAARGLGVLWVTQIETEVRWANRVVEVGPRTPAVAAGEAGPLPVTAAASVRIDPYKVGPGPQVTVRRELEVFVPASGVLGITGPNGSGKTLLIEAFAGLRTIEQLRIMSGAIPAPAILASQYPELGVFNELVEDEVAWAAVRRGRRRAEVLDDAAKIFERAGCATGFTRRRTWSLSSGERRLVHIVATLVAPSSLVILDEPTCGMDTAGATAIAEAVRTRAQNAGVVVATQDTDWLERLAGAAIELG